MKSKCSVTFEFPVRAPLTWRGEVEGTNPSTIVRRAVVEAQQELQPRNWSSLVCVILERDDIQTETDEEI